MIEHISGHPGSRYSSSSVVLAFDGDRFTRLGFFFRGLRFSMLRALRFSELSSMSETDSVGGGTGGGGRSSNLSSSVIERDLPR